VKKNLLLVAAVALSLPAAAQTNSQATVQVEHMSSTPTFRVVVVSRSVQAVNYEHRSGSSKVDFAGTTLMPSANGWAKVNSKRGSIEIEAEFGDLQRPTTFGNEYLTYVLWAISPEGRAVNLGEVLVGDNGPSGLRADRYRGTLLCGPAAEQCSGSRERSSRRHQGNQRGSQRKI